MIGSGLPRIDRPRPFPEAPGLAAAMSRHHGREIVRPLLAGISPGPAATMRREGGMAHISPAIRLTSDWRHSKIGTATVYEIFRLEGSSIERYSKVAETMNNLIGRGGARDATLRRD